MSIKQLAQALGLSTSTVSRALNGYTDVNALTRTRVQEMADAMGYRPDAGARRLVRGNSLKPSAASRALASASVRPGAAVSVPVSVGASAAVSVAALWVTGRSFLDEAGP